MQCDPFVPFLVGQKNGGISNGSHDVQNAYCLRKVSASMTSLAACTLYSWKICGPKFSQIKIFHSWRELYSGFAFGAFAILGAVCRYECSEEILTIAAMLSVNNAIFYRPKVLLAIVVCLSALLTAGSVCFS